MAVILNGLKATFWGRLTLISFIGLVVRIVYVLAVERGDPLTGDAIYYHEAANLLADGKGFIEPFRFLYGAAHETAFLDDPSGAALSTNLEVGHVEPTAGHPPLWVLILGAFSWLGFTSVLAQQLLSACIGAFGVIAIGVLGREFAGERVGLIAASLAATYAFIWMNDGLIMSETLVIILAAATATAGVRFWRRPDTRSAVVLGLLGALCALTRAELALYLPVLAAIALVVAPLRWADRARLYVIAGVVALAVVSPWVIRNLVQFDEPVFLSNGVGILLAQTNCDQTYFGDKRGYWEFECGLPQPVGDDGEQLDESERDLVYRDRGLDYIEGHTERLFTHAIPWRIGRVWAVYQPVQQLRADILVEGRTFKLSVLGLVQYFALIPLAVAGAVAAYRRRLGLVPVALWVPLVTLTAALAFGTTRYRAAAEVSLVVLAALGIDTLWRRIRPPDNEGGPERQILAPSGSPVPDSGGR